MFKFISISAGSLALATLLWAAFYWWLIPSDMRLAPLSFELPTLVKVSLTVLIAAAILILVFEIDRVITSMSEANRAEILRPLTTINYLTNALFLLPAARLLLPEIGVLEPVAREQIPIYFFALAACTAVNAVRARLLESLPARDRRDGLMPWLMPPSADEVMARDPRAPILYLRSFRNEVRAGTIVGRFSRYAPSLRDKAGMYLFPITTGKLVSPFDPRMLRSHSGRRRTATDEQIVFATFFSTIGPYVAIGRPGETFEAMDLGAAKKFVSDDHWKDAVLEYLDRSVAVVLEAGDSEGLAWEISQVVSRASPRRLLVVLPSSDADYDAFRVFAAPLFPKPLPMERAVSRLLMFDDDWRPMELESVDLTLALTLAPFCQRNGLRIPS